MANRLLLQTLVKFRDGIKSGAAKVSDVIEDYFKTTGKQPTEEERALIMNEFAKDAPSGIEAKGVEEVFFGTGDTRLGGSRTPSDVDDIVEEVDFSSDFLFTDKPKGPNVQKAEEVATIDKKPFDMETFRAGLEASYRESVAGELRKLQEASPAEKSKMIKQIINRQGIYKSFDQADISKLLRSVDDSQLQDFLKVQAQKPTTLKPKRYLGYTEDGRPIESPVYFDDMGANEKSVDFGKYKNKRDCKNNWRYFRRQTSRD